MMAIPSGEKTAFTLIELLVVIAIIALLLAVVLPALGKAKDIAKRVLCTSNLRQTGVGLRIYGGDHDEKLMPLMHVQSDKSYVPGSSAATATTSPTQPLPWNAVITHLRDRYTSDGIHLKPYHLGLLYTYNYISEPKIFYCPAQPRNESYAIGYHYDDYTENGSREWGTFVPEFPQSGHNSFVRTSYNYWIYDKTRYDELGVKPILVDNLQEWEVLPHRKSRSGDSAPQGVGALFADGHVKFSTGDNIFDDYTWNNLNQKDDIWYNGPGNDLIAFERIMRAIQGHQ